MARTKGSKGDDRFDEKVCYAQFRAGAAFFEALSEHAFPGELLGSTASRLLRKAAAGAHLLYFSESSEREANSRPLRFWIGPTEVAVLDTVRPSADYSYGLVARCVLRHMMNLPPDQAISTSTELLDCMLERYPELARGIEVDLYRVLHDLRECASISSLKNMLWELRSDHKLLFHNPGASEIQVVTFDQGEDHGQFQRRFRTLELNQVAA